MRYKIEGDTMGEVLANLVIEFKKTNSIGRIKVKCLDGSIVDVRLNFKPSREKRKKKT